MDKSSQFHMEAAGSLTRSWMARRGLHQHRTKEKGRGTADEARQRQWRLLFWRRSKRGEHMSETRFTERAQAALRLAQECSGRAGPRLCGQRAPAAGPGP